MPSNDHITFRIQLAIEVEGPDAEWDFVADALAKSVRQSPRFAKGYRVVAVALDKAEEPDDE
jgi:hypothetical protein